MKRFAVLLSVFTLLAGLALPALAKVDATVVDENSKPIPKAKILEIWDIKNTTEERLVYADSKGKFTFSQPSERYALMAVADGRTFGSNLARREGYPIRIMLLKEKLFKGRVVDERGKPLAGVTITMDRFSGSDKAHNIINFYDTSSPIPGMPKPRGYVDIRPKAVSDARGNFIISHIPDPSRMTYLSMVMSTSKGGRAIVRKNIQIDDMRRELVITVPPSCTIRGTLYTPKKAGKAPEGTLLIVYAGDKSTSTYALYSRVGKNGAFEFDNLPPGKLSITMQPIRIFSTTGYSKLGWILPKYPDIVLSAGETRTVELVGVKGAVLKG
ncbi:MAG TPA: carboxypeptidase-like regulatory domain-containing protein [Armatimonadota bacterium]|jgi:hypothetical protein